MSRSLLSITVAAALILSGSPEAFAADSSSLNFQTKNGQLNSFGGYGTSSSFSAISDGGQNGPGESTSTSFILNGGALYYDSFVARSTNWRWYDDETNETPVSPFAAENVAATNIDNGSIIKLRVGAHEVGGLSEANLKFKLQYSTASDFSESVKDVEEQGACTGTSVWCYADGGGNDNDPITAALLSGSDACASGVGSGCGTHNESGVGPSDFTQEASSTAEYEFTLQQRGASSNTVYFFRLFDTSSSSSVPIEEGSTYPSLVTGGTDFSIQVSGVSAATAIAGVSTSVDTSATNIPFGTLPSGSSVSGAQQFTVTTNAAHGYSIYAFQLQPLLGSSGGLIAPVGGTNAAPISWTSGCNATTTGCYGYHTTESVLSGGSTRFAADDTYAGFAGSPDEVAFSSGPVSGKTTNLLYRVEVENLQGAGSYASSIVYIAVPIF